MKKFSIFYFGKVGAALLTILMGMFASAHAQKLITDVTKACEGEAIVLTAEGFSSLVKSVDFYVSVNGGAFKAFSSAYCSGGVATAVYDMPDTNVTFYAESPKESQKTANVTVTLNNDCPQKCYTSSIGDYINGTDFNVVGQYNNSGNFDAPAVGTAIESHFADYNVEFTYGCGGSVTNHVNDYLGKTPAADKSSNSNFYWTADYSGGEVNCAPFEYNFLAINNYRQAVWDGKYYRLAMKVYIVKQHGCNSDNCSSARFKLETGVGSNDNFEGNADHMDIDFFDDATGTKLGEKHIAKSFADVKINDILCSGEEANDGRLIRMEIHSYGKFNLRNKNPGAKVDIKPRFQQMGCMKVAVDYVSAEMMSVCLDKASACTGTTVPVVAAGFPYGAKYVWQYQDGTSWRQLSINGFDMNGEQWRQIDVPVTKVGKQRYRVFDANTVGQTGEYIEFSITGKDCDPIQPTEIEGPANPFCVPNLKEDGKFSVSPIDANPDVKYSWTFVTPSGESFGSEKLKFEGAELQQGGERRGDVVYLMMDGKAEEGEYTVTVQPVKSDVDPQGKPYDRPAGKAISKTFMVYKRPNLVIIKEGTDPMKQDEVEICLTDDQQKFVAVVSPYTDRDGITFSSIYMDKYVYKWQSGAKGTKETADIVIDAGVCDGTTARHSASVTVEISGVGCPSTIEESWKYGPHVEPTINCRELTNKSIELASNESQKTVSLLPFPSHTVGCETNPRLSVVLDFTPVSGAKITKTIAIREKEFKDNLFNVSLPAGKGTVVYAVEDGCGSKASCTITIEVKDVTPPNVECDDIPNYTAHLQNQNGCEAVPGVYAKELPNLTAPVLSDKNNVDGNSITGQFVGRLTNPSRVPQPAAGYEASFAASTDKLNDSYKLGTTYIMWKFEDASHNASYCIQEVVVIDDRKPDVNCADSDLGEFRNNEGECGLSLNYLMDQMREKGLEKPSAKDVCSSAGVTLVPTIYYRKSTDKALIEIPESRWDEIIFDVDVKYDLVWRFFKKNGENVYAECIQNFEVKDMEAPTFDCSTLQSVRVTANVYKPQNEGYKYLEYATYKDEEVGLAAKIEKYTGTLKSYFDDKTINLISSSAVNDNCDDAPKVEIVLQGPADNKGRIETKTIKKIEELRGRKYYVGLTTITFTFTDKSGNSSSCKQDIIVTAGTTPIPDCSSVSDTVIYVDKNCDAIFTYPKSKVPTALIPVNQEGCYMELVYAAIKGLHFGAANGPSATGDICEDAAYIMKNPLKLNVEKTVTVPVGIGMNRREDFSIDFFCEQFSTNWTNAYRNSALNKWDTWLKRDFKNVVGHNGKILELSGKLTTDSLYLGYPYKLVLRDSTGAVVTEVENPYNSLDQAAAKVIVPRAYDGSMDPYKDANGENLLCRNAAYTCEYIDVKVQNNFKNELLSQKLTRGKYQLVWKFQDRKGGAQEDSCVMNITVADSIAPEVVCGDWSKSGTFEANEKCVVPVSEVSWYKKPTPADLKAKDNCTAQSDLIIKWERKYKEWVEDQDVALTNDFQLGTTTVIWYVVDASGNRAKCQQEIEVVDKSGPIFDCSSLLPIEAYTKEKCFADVSDVIAAGLSKLYTEDDKCSPTGNKYIWATYYRSDSTGENPKRVFEDDYPVGTTVITWTFTDGAGNNTICTQDVVVADTTTPIFEDCNNLQDITVELAPDECTASKSKVQAALGTHQATDNCDGTIDGVPMVMMPDNSLVPLLAAFKKDTSYHIVWVFEDSKHNRLECDQLLTIQDTTPPNPTACPADPHVAVYAKADCEVGFADLNLKSEDDMAIIDLCDGKIVPTMVAKITQFNGAIKSYIGDEAKAAKYPVGNHQVLYIYEDNAKLKDTCVIDVEVIDATKPIIEDCDARVKTTVTVSEEAYCAINPDELKALILQPKAHDECDDLLSGNIGEISIDPTVKRYKIDSTAVTDAGGNVLSYDYTITLVADGINKMWDEDPFPKGLTRLVWIFADKTGNVDSCTKYVEVIDNTPPYFDCNNINPDTLRPVAPFGSCEYDFATLKEEVLDTLHYTAYDACTGNSIPGILTLDGKMELPADYTMKVGVVYKLIWAFKDEDGNTTTCPQWILPSHQNPVNFDCSTLKPVELTAQEGECFVHQDSLKANLTVPMADDQCVEDYSFPAIPYFINATDTIAIDLETQKFVTGDTIVHWRFISMWNVFDTLWCQQKVTVLGNKKFDINCDELTPLIADTIEHCGPSDETLVKIKAPWTPDPCADPNSEDYKRYGVGTRLDSTAAHPVSMTAPFPLGNSTIRWIFTDFTGSVKDSCDQVVNVKTSADIIVDCEELKKDTIRTSYQVPDGVCTVEASLVLDKDTLKIPVAKHPCIAGDVIRVTPQRKDKKAWTDDFIVGINWIEWVFVDTTHTTINDSIICEQPFQVGETDATLFDCKKISDVRLELAADKCTADSSELNFTANVPKAYDACGQYAGQLVEPIWTRSSGRGMGEAFTVGYDTIVWKYHYNSIDVDVLCEQEIHILDSKEPIFDCDLLSDTTLLAEHDKCTLPKRDIQAMLDSLQSVLFAKDACVDTIEIQGSYDASVIPATLWVGDTINIHWIFKDDRYNLVAKECDQKITLISDIAPIISCDTLKPYQFAAPTCDTVLTDKEIRTPAALDACTQDTVWGVGERLDGGDLYGKYPAGVVTQIKWVFKSKFSTKDTFCIQDVEVLTELEPIFDCSTLDTIRVASEPGKCYADSSVVAAQLTDHYAKDSCTGKEIKGVPSYNDGPLPEKFNVGDTTLIKWTFFDPALNVNPKICYQAVIVTGDQKPIFDCNSLVSEPILIEGCDTTLSEQTIKTPYAEDACTHDSVPGVGKRLDGGELYGLYPVGTTQIEWVFVSPFSSVADTCIQDLTILTKKEIEFSCDDLLKDTVVVSVATGECSAEVTIPTQVAKHPCPDQSGVTAIYGIPSFNGENLTPNADSTQWSITLPTGIWNVTWTFTDHSNTMLDSIKSCEQPVRVGDINEMPVKCENYPDTVIKLSPNDCDITWSEINFKAPQVVDLCSNKVIEPELSRASGKSMDEPFIVGRDTVMWSYSFSGQNVACSQEIHVLDSVAPIFDCSTLQDIELVAQDGLCQVSSEELVEALGSHVAVDSCTQIEVPGRAFVNNVPVEEVSAKVGDTLLIHWVFIDSTLNAVAKECDQTLYVLGQNKPIFDCSSLKDTILYLALEECELDGARLNWNVPVAKDSCTGALVPGVASRQDGEPMTAIFAKGTTVIDWTFKSPHSITERVCAQNVVVKDTVPPVVDCSVLKDTIRVRITSESVSDNSVTAEEAAAAGLVAPSVTDFCDGEITAVGHRSDGQSMDAPYILNTKTTVVWVFTDLSGNQDSCKQVVVVDDWLVDDLICPSDITEAIQCVENIPAPYGTYEEFVLAGGSFSNESKIVDGSFTVLDDQIPTDNHCDFNVVRIYQVTDVRNNNIQCKQLIHVTDKVAPTLSEYPDNITLACTDEIPLAISLTAEDDCNPVAVSVDFEETNNRAVDPASCDYYNYVITRVWTAEDRCENKTSHTQYVYIVDTLAPTFTFPSDWRDTVLSIYHKGCTFGVPDFTVEVRSMVSDNCTDNANLKITQEPTAGSLIYTSTLVKITVEDMCGNRDSLYKYVLVPAAGSVVSLAAFDTAICARDVEPLTLWSQSVRLATGRILVEDWDGTFLSVPTAFVYDCYLDSISPNSLVYSNNPNTYLHKFTASALGSSAKADSVKAARINLRKQSQSGHYYFVAMDTLTLCSDTANSYLEVKERPRISMNSGKLDICEFNGVDTLTLDRFLRCVDDRGGSIFDEGWMLNGVKYNYNDSIFMSQDSTAFVYYAENECGRSTSLDTYLDFCADDIVPTTHADSMEYLGADSIYYYLFRVDDYKVRDSVLVDVYDRLQPEGIFVTVNEKERSTVWLGDQVKLSLHSNYGRLLCTWYAVKGKFDRRRYTGDGAKDFVFDDVDDEEDEIIHREYVHNGLASLTIGPRDTTAYYVVLSNEVCPSANGNVATVNVNDKLPTAITPFTVDGMNDVFMKSYPVKIFNRYSQMIYEGNDGWAGRSNGEMVDPGVYFYEVVMRDGTVLKGTIEVVLLK